MTSPSFLKQVTPRRTPISSSRHYLSRSHNPASPLIPSQTGSVHSLHQQRSIISEQVDIIYGTNISTKQVYRCFEQFIKEFEVVVEECAEKVYLTKLNQIDMDLIEKNVFQISAAHLKEYDVEIYYQLVYFPAEIIMCFDEAIKIIYEQIHINQTISPCDLPEKQAKRDSIMISINKLADIKVMRSLTQYEINKLICFRGIVVRISDVCPEMKIAVFRCFNCKQFIRVVLENAKVQQPKSCLKCKLNSTIQLMHNFCVFTDKQFIKFQQLPEYVPQGQTPHAITVVSYDYNVDEVSPGDRVQVVGIYRAQQVKISKSKNQLHSVYKTHLDLISYRLVDENRYKGGLGNATEVFSDHDKEMFHKMAERQNIVQELIGSFAPSIHGNTHIKKGILAQLFGGTKKEVLEQGRGRFRSDINICLVGDPSTAKSQLLQQVYKIAPRGIYTSGRGSSAVGLTANVRRDPQTKEFVLQSGALVLSDLGICCIDEFDKMDNNNKTILLEGMQQQTISIAKAGIVCQLNCRAAIISAANPIHSRYNKNKSVIQNINLSPALLSRFDLIYILLDQPNQKTDTQIATHLLNLYSSNSFTSHLNNPSFYSKQILTKYITYARQYIMPKLSQEAGDRIVVAYSEMRQMGMNRKTITATPRQLESIIRLSEAFAKMRLSQVVTKNDVEEAVELVALATQQAATDPTTGLIDMDVLVTGKTSASRQKTLMIAEKIKQIVKANVSKYKKKSAFQTLFTEIQSHIWLTEKDKINERQVLDSIKLLESEGLLVTFGSDKNKPFFKLAKDLS